MEYQALYIHFDRLHKNWFQQFVTDTSPTLIISETDEKIFWAFLPDSRT